ncbi:MarR family winged helix-turn-helix transcriptional regulator [Actinomadura kijaniata]|uniref:MarR family winged helix-turn-helix transcriptional regulator n=1 Tax=Actinomadura kijaniata TaxID=46161 RepID=UPI003F1AC6B4
MERPARNGDLLTAATIEIFAVNGRLLRVGDRLAAPVGLTTSRWQVMGLLQYGPMTIASLARERGLRRQAVQQTVARLLAEGMVQTAPNPRDGRAPLVSLTPEGDRALEAIYPIEKRWIQELADGLPPEDLAATVRTLRVLRERLDRQLADEPSDTAVQDDVAREGAAE